LQIEIILLVILRIMNIALSQTVHYENTDIKYAEEEKKYYRQKISSSSKNRIL